MPNPHIREKKKTSSLLRTFLVIGRLSGLTKSHIIFFVRASPTKDVKSDMTYQVKELTRETTPTKMFNAYVTNLTLISKFIFHYLQNFLK